MRKTVNYLLSFAVFSVASFGGGALLAEKNLRERGVGVRNVQVENVELETAKPDKPPEIEITSDQIIQPEESSVAESDSSSDLEQSDKFSFAIIGDTQNFNPKDSKGSFQQAANKINESNPDFVLSMGDLVSDCDGKSSCEQRLQSWKKIMGPLAEKSYVVMGNHDATGDAKAEELWRKVFSLPVNGPSGFSELTYSFDYGNSHFVALASNRPEEHIVDREQRAWLEQDLARTKQQNVFVFFHEPAYPVSSKIGESLDAENKERNALWAILEKYKITAVFNGHEHIHSRKKAGSIYQFGFGNTDSFNHDLPKAGMAEYAYRGTHYGLVLVEGEKITVNVHAVDGKLINSFSLK